MQDALFWILIFGCISSILSVGFYASRNVKTESSYLLANRNTGLFALVATLVMTEVNTATLIAFSGMGYAVGWWALCLPFVFLIALLWYGFTVANKWKSFNGLSVTHFFTQRYGRDIGILSGCILFAAMAVFSATYVKSMALLFSFLLPGLSLLYLTTILVFLVLIMSLRGGLVSIIRTDVISFIVVAFFMPLLLYYCWVMPEYREISPPSLREMQISLPPSFVFSLVLLTMFSYILAPWYGQKIVAAKSPKVARAAVMWSSILVFIFYGMAVLATTLFKSKGVSLTHHELALPSLIKQALPVPLQAFGYGVLFCIGATTLSGVWSAMTTLLVPRETTSKNKKRSIFLILACAITSWTLSNTLVDQILNKMILANIPIVALSFALLGGFYWPKSNRAGAYISIITGLIWGGGCYLYFGEEGQYTWYWSVYGIPLIFSSGIFGSLFYTRVALRFSKKVTV
ncbi:MAG: hypothetical protein GY915_09330 [bacterium]|nr:hypothetical protein [bacterium]